MVAEVADIAVVAHVMVVVIAMEEDGNKLRIKFF